MTLNLKDSIEHTDYEVDITKYPNSNIVYNLYFMYKVFHPTYVRCNDISVLMLDINI